MALGPGRGNLAAGAVGGLVCGALATIYAVSNAALIFSGELAGAFAAGAGLALFGSCVIGLVVALGASFRNAVPASATGPASILALIAASIAARLHEAAPEAVLPTVIAAVALTSLLTGAFLYALGFFRLGAMPRYIPFPVVGGFLAGVGWLLLLGSVRIVTGHAVSFAGLPALFTFESGRHLVPMLLLVGVLQWTQRRFRHFLTLPTVLALAIAGFYAVAALAGATLEDLRAAHWLTAPFPAGALWPPRALADIGAANLGALAAEAPRIGTILMISVLTLLLGTTSLELAAGTEIDADRELRVSGLANIAAGLGGGLLGLTGMSLSMLGRNASRDSRMPGVVAGLICGAAALGAAAWIDRLPVFVVAALLFSNGTGLLVEWIWRGRAKLPAADYLIVVLILVVVGMAGFLQGVAIGILAGVILFVVNYSRLNVVKHVLSGATYRSNVERPAHLMRRLSELGDQIHVLTLHGYLFFGTANRLVEQLRERMNDASRQRLRYVLLDFRQVHGLDSSAAASFMKLRRDAADRDLRIVITSVHADVSRQLARGGFLLPNDNRVIEFAEQDLGLEWCEDRVLGADDPGLDTSAQPHGWQGPAFSDPSMGTALRRYLEPVRAAEGDVLMRQGEHSSDLLFIDSGRVSVQLEMADGRSVRVRVFGPGTVVGEIALYLGVPRSASVIADRPTVALRLTDEALRRMRAEEPALVAEFHQYVARLLAERLSEANKLLRSVLH